ncbi:MAG: tRNA-processing RNAse [Deltaproteobacteria bacterium]|nr:tRNA-processing RNAse [Deltaproteobacteria bacterium]
MTVRLRHFFSTALWEINTAECSRVKRYSLKSLQFLLLVFRNFWRDQCLLQASALAFTSILSLVPFLAILFAILAGFGLQHQLEPLILEQLSAGSQEVAGRIIRYIDNTSMKSLGFYGLLTLFVTVFMLLDNVESSFNTIWGVKETRTLRSKLGGYIGVILSTPVLVFSTISVTTFIESQDAFQWLLLTAHGGELLLYLLRFFPYLVIWATLTFVYLIIPNTVVRLRPALTGAVIAGILWQIAQWGYIHFQIGFARKNAIYWAMAALPIFMIWIYVSWLILLFGVEIVHVKQNIKNLKREIRAGSISFRVRELLTLAILQTVVTAAVNGKGGVTEAELGDNLDLPERLLEELLRNLVSTGFLKTVPGETPVYTAAGNPQDILVADVLTALLDSAGGWQPLALTEGESCLAELLAKGDESRAATLADISLLQVAESAALAKRRDAH